MASRDEFERAVYSLVSKARDHGRRLGCFYTLEGEDEDERAAADEDAARAVLLALWPEPLTCEEEESLGCPDCVPAYYCPTHSPAKERDDAK